MSISMNIFGRLTRDPEQKQSSQGTSFVNFSVAVNHGKDASGQEQATFVDLSAFGKTAEIILKNCKKGARVNVAASQCRLDKWVTQNGTQAASLRGTVQQVDIVDWPDAQQTAPAQAPAQPPVPQMQQYAQQPPVPQQPPYQQPAPQQQYVQPPYQQPPMYPPMPPQQQQFQQPAPQQPQGRLPW